MSDSLMNIKERQSKPGIKMPLKVLIAMFWIGQLWTTPYYQKADFESYGYNNIIMYIDSILQENTLVGNRFSWYEVVLAMLGIYFLFKYKGSGLGSKTTKRIFFVSVLVVVVSFLNPNNSLSELKYYITYGPRILLFYVFLLFAFISMDKKYYWGIIYQFIYYGLIIAAIQALLSSLLFITGNGIQYLGSTTILPNSEILNVIILFSTLSLSLYFKTKRTMFILIFIIFHFTVLLSDRRAPIIVMLLSDFFIFIYYNKISLATVFRISVMSITLILAYYLFISNQKYDLEYHFLRIYSIFSATTYHGNYINDMGHFEQTARTFYTMLDNLSRFWGVGMRNTYFYVEGQSAYIHNNFVAVWSLYGLHMTLFLLFILALLLKDTLSLMRKSIKSHAFPIRAGVIISSMFILIGDAFTGEYFCKHFCYAALFAFTLSLLRITEDDEERILMVLSKRQINNRVISRAADGFIY